MNAVVGYPGIPTPYEDEEITVGTDATGLTQSKWLQRGAEATRDMGNARAVVIAVNEGRVRYRMRGTANEPTGTLGALLNEGDVLMLYSESQFKSFRVIRDSGEEADAKLYVTYLR